MGSVTTFDTHSGGATGVIVFSIFGSVLSIVVSTIFFGIKEENQFFIFPHLPIFSGLHCFPSVLEFSGSGEFGVVVVSCVFFGSGESGTVVAITVGVLIGLESLISLW